MHILLWISSAGEFPFLFIDLVYIHPDTLKRKTARSHGVIVIAMTSNHCPTSRTYGVCMHYHANRIASFNWRKRASPAPPLAPFPGDERNELKKTLTKVSLGWNVKTVLVERKFEFLLLPTDVGICVYTRGCAVAAKLRGSMSWLCV